MWNKLRHNEPGSFRRDDHASSQVYVMLSYSFLLNTIAAMGSIQYTVTPESFRSQVLYVIISYDLTDFENSCYIYYDLK